MPGLSLSNGLLLLLPVYIFAHCNDYDLTVTLRNPPSSRVKGECRSSGQGRTYHSFSNIPYAESPVGKRRLQKPEPKKSWKGTHQSSGKKRECVQDSFLPGIDLTFGTEDCLVLNVYTPVVVKNSSTLLPVLFFIHGGGFQTGSGTNMVGLGFDQYDPSLFMDQEIVVITINYRLGALGFLTTEDEVIPANLGLRDQSLALKWVQGNIDMFGGDPKDVVISGESAGAASVCHLLLSNVPEMEAVTAGIMTSGTCLSPFGLNMDAREKAFDVGRKLGYHFSENNSASLLKILQSVPVEILFNVTRVCTSCSVLPSLINTRKFRVLANFSVSYWPRSREILYKEILQFRRL
ncbi:unnamed protein product [Acanthoscelides obtectus]|uniref:Carboxylic ester hydrolase n=1 Tax=Acanthoscelides obtectus TaxID=200917 RepID=A0A9P0JY36_ACAOB|nr:unnamed protein product [Acanthoscelides obtectus]CAK1663377.1 hypothetical protein AOBTE_LOCUS23642 [Acanthoscelides obtectus]